MMRRKIPYRVCSCAPDGVVTHLEARLLKEMVNREIHPIRCAESCKQKYKRGMRIGDLCAETGHFGWALKVWKYTAKLIVEKDYDDWIDVYFHIEWGDLQVVISESEYELLLKRCGYLYQLLGFPEEYWWTRREEFFSQRYFGRHGYYWLFAEKNYGYSLFESPEEFEKEMNIIRKRRATEMLFHEILRFD